GAVAGLLGRASGRIALNDEDFRAAGRVLRAVGELAGKAQLAHGGLAVDFLLLATADALVGARNHPVEKLRRVLGVLGQPVIERIAYGLLDDTHGLGGGEPVLGLADEIRLADEYRQHARRRDHHVLAGDGGRALVADELGIGFQPAQERGAEARLVRAAFCRGDRVAVGVDEAVAPEPGDGPFDRSVAALALA